MSRGTWREANKGYRTLNEGDRVEFEIGGGTKGPQAPDLRRLDGVRGPANQGGPEMILEVNELQEHKNGSFPTPYLRFKGFHLNLQSEVLTKGGVRILVGGKIYQALIALLENAGQPVTREALRARLWPGTTLSKCEANINTTVNKLRHLLGDDRDAAARLINTVPRLGYAFVGKVEYDDAPETIAPTSERSPAENVRNSVPRTASREVCFAAGVIVLTVAGMLLGAAITLYLHRPL
jgi:DNA-binding winged helix-turn-helix (wHTH) protein